MSTFDDAVRRVMLRIPSASYFLVKDWIQEAYAEACTRRSWSHLRVETTLRTKVSRDGTCAVTQDSTTVTGGTLVFAATDVGRQFRITAGATAATLDRVWAGATDAALTARICDVYQTMPADFKTADLVIDPSRWWQLHLWVTEHQLARWDATRTYGGPPLVLASATLSPVAADEGRVRYELWPHSLVEAYWPMTYFKLPEELSPTTRLLGPFLRRPDVLVEGALWKAAQWPGPSTEQKNPYFNLALAAKHEATFNQKLDMLQVVDEDVYPSWLQPDRYTLAPLNAAWLQQTDYSLQYG
jgi:hypothetical protein